MAKGKPTNWTEAMITKMIADYPMTSNKDLAKSFGIGWRTVVRKARELQLEKDPAFRDTVDFKTMLGVFPPNKGKPFENMPEACKKNWFKKGRIVSEEERKLKGDQRRRLVEIEKARVKYGLGQRTKIRIKI